MTITGVCAAERRRYARHAAVALRRHRVDVRDLTADTDPVLLHATLHSSATITVVDARHALDDLRGPTPLRRGGIDSRGDVGARARQFAQFVELATAVVLVNWESVPTTELSLLMTVLSHLGPTARLRLSRGAADDLVALRGDLGGAFPPAGERPGWTRILNDEHDPFLTDRRVVSMRYEQLRPFHPERLMAALESLDSGRHGILLRSAGLCRIATRPNVVARWEHAGSAIWIDPQQDDDGLAEVGQDLALTGIDLNREVLRRTLDDAVLTDAELASGPHAWRRFADPLPAWPDVARSDRRAD